MKKKTSSTKGMIPLTHSMRDQLLYAMEKTGVRQRDLITSLKMSQGKMSGICCGKAKRVQPAEWQTIVSFFEKKGVSFSKPVPTKPATLVASKKMAQELKWETTEPDATALRLNLKKIKATTKASLAFLASTCGIRPSVMHKFLDGSNPHRETIVKIHNRLAKFEAENGGKIADMPNPPKKPKKASIIEQPPQVSITAYELHMRELRCIDQLRPFVTAMSPSVLNGHSRHR